MNELELIKNVQAGDDASFAYLVERYWVGLVIYCERLLDDRDEAEDAAQQSFIKAYNSIKSFDNAKSSFSTWLYRIARNTTIDNIRANKQTLELDAEYSDDVSENQVHDEVETEEMKKAVRAYVKQLKPDEYRTVVEGYYWYGKSYKILADELDVPINTIKTWIHRAKQQLKEKLYE